MEKYAILGQYSIICHCLLIIIGISNACFFNGT